MFLSDIPTHHQHNQHLKLFRLFHPGSVSYYIWTKYTATDQDYRTAIQLWDQAYSTTLQQSTVGIQLYSQQRQCHTIWTRPENLLIPCKIAEYHINDCENCVFWHVTSQKFTSVFGWAFGLQQTFQRNPIKVAGSSERLVNFYQTT